MHQRNYSDPYTTLWQSNYCSYAILAFPFAQCCSNNVGSLQRRDRARYSFFAVRFAAHQCNLDCPQGSTQRRRSMPPWRRRSQRTRAAYPYLEEWRRIKGFAPLRACRNGTVLPPPPRCQPRLALPTQCSRRGSPTTTSV